MDQVGALGAEKSIGAEAAYDEEHRPMPRASGTEVLRYLMQEHGISQSDLPEVGAQSVVSAILSGKRTLNWRQVSGLSDRFGVSSDAFKESPSERIRPVR